MTTKANRQGMAILVAILVGYIRRNPLIPTTLRCGSSVGSSIAQIAAETITARLFTTDLGWHNIPVIGRFDSSDNESKRKINSFRGIIV